MSTIETNTVKPISGSSTLTLGESGDTVTLGSGASSSGFGPSLTGSTNNTVVTVTGADAMQGEANLTFDGGTLTVTDDASSSSTETLVITNGTSANPSYANLVFKTGGNTSGCWIKGVQASSGNDGRLEFYTNNAGTVTERMRIMYNGVVKVNSRMIIDAEVSNVAKISSEFGANNEMGISFNDKDSASNGRFIEFKRGGTEIGQIKRDGTNDNISYVTSSDYRLKDGIVDKTDGIEKVKQLQPRKFYWLSNPNQTLVDGFIAHEVSDVVPEAISGEKDATETYTDENGDEQTRIIPQGIDQSKLVPLLTAALKEAITKIETLEARVEALENA